MILHWFSNSQFDPQNLPNFPRANLQNILNTPRKYYWTKSRSRILFETKTLLDKSNLFVFAAKVHTNRKEKKEKPSTPIAIIEKKSKIKHEIEITTTITKPIAL